MDAKETITETFEFLSQELIRERFKLRRLKSEIKAIEKQKEESKKLISEIKNRIDYNLDKHGDIFKDGEDGGTISGET